MEIWKVLENTQGRYEISSAGRVRMKEHDYIGSNGAKYHYKENYPKLSNDAYGYQLLHYRGKNGKHHTVKMHRAVAMLFIPNPENKPEVNHINGIKTDNRVENLEWVTSSENKLHAIKLGLMKPEENLKKSLIPKGKENKSAKTLVVYYDGDEFARYTPVYEATKDGFPHTMIYKCMNRNRTYKGHYTFETIDNETFGK